MTVDLHTGPACTCEVDKCIEFVDEQHYTCVRRVGNCFTIYCKQCSAYTWHNEDKCLRCKDES